MNYAFPEHSAPYWPETIADIDRYIANGERITVDQAMELLGLDLPGIDTALPQPWVDEAFTRTGLWAGGNVVFSFRPEHGSPSFGAPVALTSAGLTIIRAMRKGN